MLVMVERMVYKPRVTGQTRHLFSNYHTANMSTSANYQQNNLLQRVTEYN